MKDGSAFSYASPVRGGEYMSNEELQICAREGCEEAFSKKKHNQKYHSDECCRLATNQKIMQKYYERRAQRLGQTRMCKQCGVTKLSRYNDDQVCSACKSKSIFDANNSVLDMLNRAIA